MLRPHPFTDQLIRFKMLIMARKRAHKSLMIQFLQHYMICNFFFFFFFSRHWLEYNLSLANNELTFFSFLFLTYCILSFTVSPRSYFHILLLAAVLWGGFGTNFIKSIFSCNHGTGSSCDSATQSRYGVSLLLHHFCQSVFWHLSVLLLQCGSSPGLPPLLKGSIPQAFKWINTNSMITEYNLQTSVLLKCHNNDMVL